MFVFIEKGTQDGHEEKFKDAADEDIDVRAKYMEDAMGNTTASATPEDQVDALISQVADEHQLDVSFALDDAGQIGTTAPAQQQAAIRKQQQELAAILARHPRLRVRVEGFAQTTAPPALGHAVAQARATSVRADARYTFLKPRSASCAARSRGEVSRLTRNAFGRFAVAVMRAVRNK